MPDSNGIFVVFYAWQSDTPSNANRQLIRDAADEACTRINLDVESPYKVRLDQDTQDVPGLCDIPATILSKIEASDIVLCDLTYVAKSEPSENRSPRHCSNPNVLFELGYAFRAVGWERLVCVMNMRHGPTSEQIFDLDHRRHPISYKYPTDGFTRKEVVENLGNEFEDAFRSILENAPPRELTFDAPLEVAFASSIDRSLIGDSFSIELDGRRICADPPDYEPTQYHGALAGLTTADYVFGPANRDFYREADHWLHISTLTMPVLLQVVNNGTRVLSGVRVVLRFPKTVNEIPTNFVFCLPGKEPRFPQRRSLPNVRNTLVEAVATSKQTVALTNTPDAELLSVHFDKLQAKQTDWSLEFRVGCPIQAEIPIKVTVYADEFCEPQELSLAMSVASDCLRLSVAEFDEWYDEVTEQEE